jgi:hypothetical protein
MVSLLQKLQRFRRCEFGAVISAELVIVGTVVAAGLATGWAAVQNSVVNELRDLSEAVSALDQTYSIAGHRLIGPGYSCLASSAGSRYVDTHIVCDEEQPAPMSECCLSPVIIHDTTRPGHWRCDRCGHQHHATERHGAQQPPPPPRPPEPRDGGSDRRGMQPSGPPPVPPVPEEHSRPRPQPDAERGSPRPQPDPGPERRPSDPPRQGDRPQTDREPNRRPPERGESDGKSGPFTPRDNPPARRQKTSESGSGSELLPPSEEPDDITQSDLYMLARLPVQDPYGGTDQQPGPSHFQHHHHHSQPHDYGQPHEHGQPPHLHSAPIHELPGPPLGYPHPFDVPPRYEFRGHREPISTPWGHGPAGLQAGCRGCDSCGYGRTGSIRPGVEFYSGVRGVRVTEIPQCCPEPTPYAHGPHEHMPYEHVPYQHGAVPPIMGNHPGVPHPQPVWPAPYRVNRHEPRFPNYVWQPSWQIVW